MENYGKRYLSDTEDLHSSDDDFIGPDTQDFLEVDDDCYGELTQNFDEASQLFQKLPLYYRIGSGFEARPGGSTDDGLPFVEAGPDISEDDLEDAIVLEERRRKKNAKYNGEEICFRARVETQRLPQHLNGAQLCSDVLRVLFSLLLRRTTEGLRPTDMIRFCIQADGLDKPVSTCLMPVSQFTVEHVLSIAMKVLQSKDEIKLDEGFSVDVITIRRDIGGGRMSKVINIEVDRLRKKSILVIPEDEDGLCCAKAIVYALAHLKEDRAAINAMKDRRRPALTNRARALHEAAQVPLGPCTFTEIGNFENHLNVQIAVFSAEALNKLAYKGIKRPDRINLWLHNNHFDVIKSMKGFYGSKYYCDVCDKPYFKIENHYCSQACSICQRSECIQDQSKRCPDCDRICQSEDCFTAHKSVTGRQELSLCDRVFQCRKCCKLIRRRDCPKENHRCYTVKCPSCKQYVDCENHFCYLKKLPSKKPSENLIFFDFETDQSSGEHLVNYAVAQYADGREKIFKGYEACSDFCSWLFQPKHKGFTAVAHNMKGFDGQFIMAWLLEQGTAPEVIPNGSMLMTICLKTLDIRIIDSMNFLPMALCKLPDCFGLHELKKGYFPHYFNTEENQAYIGLLPDPHFYGPDMMTPAARQTFMHWYEVNRHTTFNFQEEILAYCRSDVDILRRCCLEFRSQFIEVSKVDPFQYVTIASACMAVFRSQHIQTSTIAMVPNNQYVNHTNFSADSIRWLDFISLTENIQIQHALNHQGEKKIGGVSVDGFCEETKTIYQYHGCFFHGCVQCYESDLKHPFKGTTMGEIRDKTRQTSEKLKELGFNIVEMWEHEFLRQKKENDDLVEFLKSHDLQDRLKPRDAFFGGRTNAVRLFYEGRAKYVDFTSLYPWVNKYCAYPVGHPEIITESFNNIDEYFGIVKCKVLPPKKLYLPVLPYRSNGKLMFPLCRRCTEDMQQTPCTHSDEERALSGTWVTEEIKLALSKGYRLSKVYEIYHFPRKSTTLFRSYIDLFLKIKQESSGWPAECQTIEQKNHYIESYEEKEGVKLDATAISKNPGRRQVAKLALNSFWGRWGMNLNRTQLSFVTTLPDFNKMLTDTSRKIKDVYFPSEEVAAIQWEKRNEFIEQDASTNIFLAAFTTAWARMKLYTEMDKLGRDVLYHDTDSIVYAQNGENDPPLGNFLGEFTDELGGDVITKFVSGGPKNYAFQTESGKTHCKVRGFTLNFRNLQLLNFDSVRAMVCSIEKNPIPLHNPSKICRDAKRRKVVNKAETKLYKVVYNKRVVQPDLTTLPYGY